MDRKRLDALFGRANSRLADFELDECKRIEIQALNKLKWTGPAGVRDLLRDLKGRPVEEAWRKRAHHSLRRIYRQMLTERVEPDLVQVGLNAYLDGQTDSYETWLTADLFFRPWGVP